MELSKKQKKKAQRIDLDDRVWGISGTVVGTEPAHGIDGDQELKWVYYIPLYDSKNHLKKFFLRKLPFIESHDVRRLPEPIPAKAIEKDVSTPDINTNKEDADGAGQPTKKWIIKWDKNGDSPYNDQIETRESRTVQRLEQQAKQSSSDSLKEKAKALSERSDTEEEDKSRPQNRREEEYVGRRP